METVLVTGGAGFIGSHLIRHLLDEDRTVVCLDNFNDYYDPQIKRRNVASVLERKNYHLAEGDIRNVRFLDDLFRQFKFSKIAHLAAMAGVRNSILHPALYADVNLTGTVNLLEKALHTAVSTFVFGSTSSVYGSNRKIPFSESDPIEGVISPYAATKLACEQMCSAYHSLHGMGICCLRFFTEYGPAGRPDMAMYKFTDAICHNREIEMYGDGTSRRDYTYVDDIVQGITSAMDRKWQFEIINLGESQTTELRQMISMIEGALSKKAKIKQLPMQPGDVMATYADISKARRLLDYKPSFPVAKGIEQTVKWYLDNLSRQ